MSGENLIPMTLMVPTQDDPEEIKTHAEALPRQGDILTLPDNRHLVVSKIEWAQAYPLGEAPRYRPIIWLGL